MTATVTTVEELEHRIAAGRVMTVREAADALSLSPTSVQLLVERGALRAWRTTGGHRRILPESVKELLRERGLAAEAPPMMPTAPSGIERGALDDTSPVSAVVLDLVIAEDDEFICRLYQARLRMLGFPIELRFARDGVQALLALGSRVPDALILDLGLPGLNGVDTLRALRGDSRTARLPVVVVTGMTSEQIATFGALPAGVTVLGKPVPFERLSGYLEALYGLKQPC